MAIATPALPPNDASPLSRLSAALSGVVLGQEAVLADLLTAFLARGHVLLEGVPGVAKTLTARSLSSALGLSCGRVQFTPDLMPSDILGTNVFRPAENVFRLVKGPIFTEVLVADEINRTPPKTQAALLEAMAESQVSVDGATRPLPKPFVVIATDNPIEYEGTYALPEAQLDRFLLRVRMGYLPPADEAAMLRRRLERAAPEAVLTALSNPNEVLAMRAALESVEVGDDLVAYIISLINATRTHAQIQVGASPRGGLALVQLARGRAVLDGRDYVTPEDVKSVAVPALAHRITLRPELWVRRINADDVIAAIVSSVATPRTVPET